MPNILDANGLQVKTREELVEYFTEQYRAIYGADINLESNTPDGQMMNIYIQAILDQQDLTVQVYNSMDPDNAIGVVLDQRVTINGIQRQAATYTKTNVTLVLSKSVNLYGLDGLDPGGERGDGNAVYTVADNAGNRWQLVTSQLGVGPGTAAYEFVAVLPGAQLTIPNTITVQVTVVLGVTSVNNPTTYTSLGENEEQDDALRLRRQRSVSLASQGYLKGLIAALLNVSGVTSAFVYENLGDAPDVDGVPGHSIWVIVAGNGAAAMIAQAIYTKRNAGCGMKGDQTYNITQEDGTLFTVRWDEVVTRTVFIRFTVSPIDGVTPVSVQLVREGVAGALVPEVNERLNVNQIATLAQEADPNTLVTAAGVSLGVEQTLSLSGVPASGDFKLNYDGAQSAVISWNDDIGTIQSKVQAVPGLSGVLVTGSLAGQELVFDLSALSNVMALLYVEDNTLQTVAPADITFAYDADYANTLAPPSKANQLVVLESNVIVLAVSLLPASSAAQGGATVQFAAAGGYGAYTYSLSVDNSGASIDAETGLYTAGNVAGTDTVRVTDKLGNTATATVTVA
jgi:uncharacterized phage protein gp47/JayE